MNYTRLTALIAGVAVVSSLTLSGISCHSKTVSDGADSIGIDVIDSTAVAEQYMSVSDIDPEGAARWADSVMNGLSVRQRVAQLFVPRLDIFPNAAGFGQLKNMVVKEQVGGILLGKGSIDGYAELINKAQEEASVPLMITLDGEWGLAMRVAGTPKFPSNVALGASRDASLMVEYGREMARQCREMGIQVNFAPVLDVNSNPSNPVIGYRSFGEDASLVGLLGSAYCMGLEDGGVMSVGKHFPGHGDTSIDSHKALPTICHDITTLQNVDFLPFVNAISSGMSGIMVGHLKVPALDTSGTPASMSKDITTRWLQDSLGFDGLVFTDALAMKGAAGTGENNCVRAFLAGADVLLGSLNPSADIRALMAAVESGKISRDEVDRRCRKMLEYKYRLGLNKKPHVERDSLASRLSRPEVADLISRMSDRIITVLRDDSCMLPIESCEKVAVVIIGDSEGNEFAERCANYAEVETFTVNKNAPLTLAARAKIKKCDAVTVGVFSNGAWVSQALKSLGGINNRVTVFFINPFKMVGMKDVLSGMPAIVVAYDDIPALRKSAADGVFGKIDVTGRMPVNLPGVAKTGDGIDKISQ